MKRRRKWSVVLLLTGNGDEKENVWMESDLGREIVVGEDLP